MLKIDVKILLLFFGRLIQSTFAIVTIKIMTVFLPQSEIGNQYLIQSLLLGFVLVLINPVGMFVNRHFHEWKVAGYLHFAVRELNFYFALVAILSFPLVFLIRFFIDFGVNLETFSIAIFVLTYIYISTWFQTIASFFNLIESQKTFVFLNILAQSLGILFAYAFINFFGVAALPWLSGLLAGQALSLLLAVALFKKVLPKNTDTRHQNRLIFSKVTLIFCIPVAITTLFMWFSNQGYRLFIGHDIGIDSLAALGLGLGLTASFSGAIESVVTQYFYPKYYVAIANSSIEQRRDAWNKLWRNLSCVYVPTFFLTIMSCYFLVRFLTTEKFYHIYYFIYFGAFIELLRQLTNIAYLAVHGEKKTEYAIMPYLVGAITLIILLIGLKFLGNLVAVNVAVALIFVNLISMLFSLTVAKKLIDFHVDLKLLFKSFTLGVVILIPWFLIDVNTPLWGLFFAEFLGGSLWACVIYILFSRVSND